MSNPLLTLCHLWMWTAAKRNDFHCFELRLAKPIVSLRVFVSDYNGYSIVIHIKINRPELIADYPLAAIRAYDREFNAGLEDLLTEDIPF